jgi:hypothetical protein
LQEAFLSKTYLIQTEKQCSRCSYFWQMVFFREIYVFLHLSWTTPIWRKQNQSPPWNTSVAGSTPFKI